MNRTRWSRPVPAAQGPDRSPAGLFRNTAERRAPSIGVGQDDMFRIIKGAYDIADRQIERGMEAARTLREASVAGGMGEPLEGLRRGERLGQDTLMLLMEWATVLSSAGPAALGRSWAGRLPELETALLERVLGLVLRPAAPPGAPAAPRAAHATAPQEAAPAQPPGWPFQFQHLEKPRPLPLKAWHGTGTWPAERCEVFFASETKPGKPIKGSFAPTDTGTPRLSIALPARLAPGVWRAALCTAEGVQTGLLQFEL